jgi:glutamine synthetase
MDANRRLRSLAGALKTASPEQNLAANAVAATIDHYGKHQFKGAVADKYLSKYGESGALLQDYSWTQSKADTVAKAVLDWAIDMGADTYCHIFQPMASGGVRHGQTAMVQLKMVEFDHDNNPIWDFKGKTILKGETDGSSYPNGGMRATHTAGGYLAM